MALLASEYDDATAVFANRFFLEKVDGFSIAYFGFESKFRYSTTVHAFSISQFDIEQNRVNWEEYLGRNEVAPPEPAEWKPLPGERFSVLSTNNLLFAKTGNTGEIQCRSFHVHELANSIKLSKIPKNKGIAPPLKARNLLSIRTPIDLQTSLLICLLSDS
ncbi:hypothetical protein FEM03_19735 [Phragmitibacter flavus]|uniref:Uncharacterized protein n=1 Tax=Phragmitibacter flavus TaxID=2576071 RepID=A0A5R8KC01_9BACT|nr:hypothetical protein [Phragmitibacter flavus]TLD69099.1 hypothetical protein FEM03_19735 [Phragmitibacter flavus]